MEKNIKIALIGDHKVGKTSFRNLLTNNANSVWLSSVLYGGEFSRIVESLNQQGKENNFAHHYWEIQGWKDKNCYFDMFSKYLHVGTSLYIFMFDMTRIESLTFYDDLFDQIFGSAYSFHQDKPNYIFPASILLGTFYDKSDSFEMSSIIDKALTMTQTMSKKFYNDYKDVPFIKFSCISKEGLADYRRILLKVAGFD